MVKTKCEAGRNRRLAVTGVAASLLFGAVIGTATVAAADDINVQIDQAAPIRLDRPAATIFVGNPGIADISAQDNSNLFVVGRTMGTTNVVAVDNTGNMIADVKVNVTSPGDQRVVLHRNIERYSYTCAPNCERVQMPGDIVSTSNPIPVYGDLDESNKRKVDLAKEGKKVSEDVN